METVLAGVDLALPRFTGEHKWDAYCPYKQMVPGSEEPAFSGLGTSVIGKEAQYASPPLHLMRFECLIDLCEDSDCGLVAEPFLAVPRQSSIALSPLIPGFRVQEP